jgi:hypothetical protein
MSRVTYAVGAAGGGYDLLTPSLIPTNEGFAIMNPPIRPNAGAKGIVGIVHGASGSARQGGSGGLWEPLMAYLADVHGYVCCSIDAGSNGVAGAATNPDTWASNIAMGALDAFFKWATQGKSSGTSTAVAATTLTDTTQNWRINEWQGHALTAGGKTAYVLSNTATVLTITAAGWTGGTPSQPAAYSIAQHFVDVHPYGKTNKVILIGASMGGWIVRNWAARNTAKVACIVDIAGVVSMSFQYGNGSGTSMDGGYGPAIPPSAPGTPTGGGTGTTSYFYQTVETSALGDGPASAGSTTVTLKVAVGSLGASPITVPTIVHPAYNSSAHPITGTKILRNSGAATVHTETVPAITLAAATGTIATTTIAIPAIPAGMNIPSGSVMRFSHASVAEGGTGSATTQDVTLTAAASAGATSLTVTSYTPAAAGAGTAWPIGSKLLLRTFVDRFTGAGTAYTQRGVYGAAYANSCAQLNGANASPSYDPVGTGNMPAGLQAIPLQLWWSENDGGTSTGSGNPATPNTQVQAYKDAYGANAVLKNIVGGPTHNSVLAAIGASGTMLREMAAFINANQP